MGLKIRLRQQGRNNRAFYRLVVTDVRCPRDGKYTEALGWYNPLEQELDKNLFLKADRIQYWLDKGAQLSEGAISLVARGAPGIVRQQTERAVAKRAKTLEKRKAKKQVA